MDDILGLLKGELAAHSKELGLARLQKRLSELAVHYRDALSAAPPSVIQWGQVRAARADGHGMLLEAVAIIVGKHHARTPQGTEARLALLGPILKQNEAVGRYLKARRSIADVNPDTGEDDASAAGASAEPGAKGTGGP